MYVDTVTSGDHHSKVDHHKTGISHTVLGPESYGDQMIQASSTNNIEHLVKSLGYIKLNMSVHYTVWVSFWKTDELIVYTF